MKQRHQHRIGSHHGIDRGLGRERYVPAFRNNEIDWEVLPKLTSEDLREIGALQRSGTGASCWTPSLRSAPWRSPPL
jgi:hypothetical protein